MEVLLYLSEPIYALGIFFIILTAIAFSLRLYTKLLNKSSLGCDDLFLLLAILCFDTENAIQLYCLKLAREIKTPTEPLFTTYMKWIWISTTFAVPTLTFIKLSVLFFYRRIFTSVRWFRIASLVLIVIVALYGISGSLGEILQCIPPEANWNFTLDRSAKCMAYDVYAMWLMSYVILDTVLDAIILALPLVMILRLQLPAWKKHSLVAIFLLGGFTVATNIVRLSLMNANRDNMERIGMINEMWISIHCGCGIVCACLPLYGPLVARFTSLAGSLRQTYSGRKSSAAEVQDPMRERPTRSRSSYIRMEKEGSFGGGAVRTLQGKGPTSAIFPFGPRRDPFGTDNTASVV